MFFLPPGRYIIGDPEYILDSKSLQNLFKSGMVLNSFSLHSHEGLQLALKINKTGMINTSINKKILINSSYIAFIPFNASEKLLCFDTIRLSIEKNTLLYFNEYNHIVIEGKFYIEC